MNLSDLFGPDGFNASEVLAEESLRETGVDAEVAFQDALEAFGLRVEGPIVRSEQVVRCAVLDKRHSTSKPGWYIWWGRIGNSDVHAGCYGDWRHGETGEKWTSRDAGTLSAEHRAEYERAMDRMRIAREKDAARRHAEAAVAAAKQYEDAGPADPNHPYLHAKQVGVYGIKQAGPRLVIPLRNARGEIRTLQYISANADKLMLKGGQKRGCFHLIGERLESPTFVAEGYSTGATVHELTGRPVVVAVDAGNIRPVIEAIRGAGYSGHLVIAADNDRFGVGDNTGVKVAQASCGAGVTMVVPQFRGAEGTDFNDLFLFEGREVAAAQLQPALEDVNDDDARYRRATALANGTMKIEVSEREIRQAEPFPVDGLEQLTRWICDRTGAEYGVGPQMAALAVAALAASRRYQTPQGDGVHLHQIISAQSFAEVAPLLDAVTAIVREAGLRRMLAEQRFTSSHAMTARLYRSPAMLYLPIDFGRRFFGPRYASIEELNTDMGRNFARERIPIDSPHEYGLRKAELNDGDQAVIQCPAFNLLGFTAESDLPNLFADQYMGRGLIETLLFGRVTVSYPQEGRHDEAPPPGLLAVIRSLRGLTPDGCVDVDQETLFGDISELVPQTVCAVDFSSAPPAARYGELTTLSDDAQHRPLVQSARSLMRRVAALLACWQQPRNPVVTPAMLGWACHYVAWSTREIIQASRAGAGEDGKSDVYDKVLAYIGAAGPSGIKHHKLVSGCRAYRNLKAKRGELLQQMEDDGVIIKRADARSTYVLASLVTVTEQKVENS